MINSRKTGGKRSTSFEDHFSHMESAMFRQMTQERQDETEIDALLDQLFPTA